MQFVINEWLLEYLRPQSNDTHKITALKIISKLIQKGDKIVIRRPSRFLDKFYRYMKVYGADIEFKTRFKGLSLLFLNSEQTIFIDDKDVLIKPSQNIINKTPFDDYYLIEAALNLPDSIIITTDTRLKEALKDEQSIKIILLDEFIKDYL